jgi:WG repeat protein
MTLRLVAWLAFAGWVAVPILVVIVAGNAKGLGAFGYSILDAGLILMAALFAVGVLGWVLAPTYARTRGLRVAGASHVVGLLALAALAVLGFRTDTTNDFSTNEQLLPFHEKRSWLWHDLGSGSGYKDRSGKVVIPPRFEWANAFHHGLGIVQWHGRWGYVDASGRLAIEARFLTAEPFEDDRAKVVDGEGPALIDRAGQVIDRPKPEEE